MAEIPPGEKSMSIRENLERVRERIERAAESAGRDSSGITIIGVSKTHGPDKIMEAVDAGIADLGENRVQEFLGKVDRVQRECRWHLIGHLQTNKVSKVIGRFTMIHSVDSLKLAEKLGRASADAGIVTDILLEVNTSGEGSKNGIDPEGAVDLCHMVSPIMGIRLKGLMTVGPWVDDIAVVTRAFEKLRRLGEDVTRAGIENVEMEHLSMGMTDDFEAAIAEGSTMLRLGRVLFGERSGG